MPGSHSAAARAPQWFLSAVIGAALLSPAMPFARSTDATDISSTWRTQPIQIDGADEDWQGLVAAVAGQRFAIGVLNDSDAVYLCLVTRDRVLATQIQRQGLMVWFDPVGTKKHAFGVQFPIDPQLRAMRDPALRPPPSGGEHKPDAEWPGQGAVGILGPGKGGPKRVPMEEAGGMAARLAVRGEILVCEMKIPLKAGEHAPYAVNAVPGATLRLELETPEWRGPMPVARGPVAIGVAGPGPGGRMMVGYPPIDGAMLKPMHAAMTLHLSAGPQ